MPQTTILWNASAGWDEGEQAAGEVRSALSDGDQVPGFAYLRRGDDFAQKAREQIWAGARLVVAAGGDGTINAAASAVVNTPAALGVIPAGTLNHFARDLGIPLDPKAAAVAIRNGQQILVDVGEVNGQVFINNSVLGLYPDYWAARQAFERRGLGGSAVGRFFAVIRAMARVFWRLPHLRISLRVDHTKTAEILTPFVLVANNEHDLENWNLGHRCTLNDGSLWIYVMHRASRWSMLRYLASFLFKRFSRHHAFTVYRATEVRVESDRKHLKVSVDGEIVRMITPLIFKSLPQALRVIAPASYVQREPA